jgi:AcrR family transcriptional regulator
LSYLLDRETLVVAAAALVDERGAGALTLADLARRLGVRTQSLYSHIASIDDLQHELALYGVRQLGEELRTTAIGRSGRDASTPSGTAIGALPPSTRVCT